jgi:hypothetical protein
VPKLHHIIPSQVTYRYSKQEGASKYAPKPLLLKSPVHTARIPLLLKLFPRARFVYLHRNPYEVSYDGSLLIRRCL